MNSNRGIEKPIFIVGAARSGTTFLAEALRRHPDVLYLREPNELWLYGHETHPSDLLRREDVTEEIQAYLIHHLSTLLRAAGKQRLLDKTPHNSLRIGFLHAIFPDAKFIHIIRDGRDVALSAAIQWRGGRTAAHRSRLSRMLRKARKLLAMTQKKRVWRSDPEGLRFYVVRILRILLRTLRPTHPPIWGPRFPGIQKVARSHTLLETCALQWEWCVRQARMDGQTLGDASYLEIRFEDLLQAPGFWLQKIQQFAELPPDDAVLQYAEQHVRPHNTGKWRKVPDETIQQIVRHIGPLLKALGYLEP